MNSKHVNHMNSASKRLVTKRGYSAPRTFEAHMWIQTAVNAATPAGTHGLRRLT